MNSELKFPRMAEAYRFKLNWRGRMRALCFGEVNLTGFHLYWVDAEELKRWGRNFGVSQEIDDPLVHVGRYP